MSRPLRIQYPGAVYHIMNRGRARQPTFVDETDYRAFLETLAEAHRQLTAWLNGSWFHQGANDNG